MRKLLVTLSLTFTVLLFSAVEAWSLPKCPGSYNQNTWHNCFATYISDNGDKYIGGFRDGKYHGQGTYTFGPSSQWAGDKYVGEFRNNKANGQGAYTHANGDKYVGEFRDGNRNGQGIYTYANGDTYVGEYRDDVVHGQGTYTYASGDKYVGEFRDGNRNGQGIYTYANGDKYVGEYRDDAAHGQGTYTFGPSSQWAGDKYVGEFRDDKRNGQGTYTFGPSSQWAGDKYVGELRDDEYHGQGTYTFADGRVTEGVWKNNEFQFERKDPKVEERREAEREAERRKQERIAREKQEKQRRQADNGKVIAVASGTGFVVSKSGHIITNNHVIKGCQEVKVHTKGDIYKAKVLRRDTVNDLAVIKASFLPSWVFPVSRENAGLMQEIYVAGYPFGETVSSSVKITRGIVSSLSGIGDNFSQIQIDAALQPGNSGGPIIDETGHVVGVAVSKLDLEIILKEYGVVPEGTNFGIKSSVVRNFLEANGLELREPLGNKVSIKELSQHITDGTLFLTCWMTYAQLQKLKTQKVMFKDLQ